ncbi:MAG: hypothetical protein K5644_08630 [Lachnospiraceae bacterium]|nr:hypothetical protein [Lachnospiraceae bacterium]
MLDMILGAVVASSVSSVVEHAAIGVMGGIATYMEGQEELKARDMEMKQLDMKMKQMEMNNRLLYERPNDYIQMRTNQQAFTNYQYTDAVKNLAGMGFYDININSLYVKKGMFEKERTGMVSRVSINGNSTFVSTDVFPKDSHVVVDAITHQKGMNFYMPELEQIRRGSVMYQRPERRCQYCNLIISQGQKFCIGCGAPV